MLLATKLGGLRASCSDSFPKSNITAASTYISITKVTYRLMKGGAPMLSAGYIELAQLDESTNSATFEKS